MKHLSIIVAFAVVLGIASGCGAARPNKYYQLTIPGDVTPTVNSSPYPVALSLGPITASPLYRGDHIVYSAGGESMGTYEYQRWAEPPAEMIQDVLRRQLRASGRYRTVSVLSSNARGDYLLRGQLYDFKEVSTASEAARVTLELELRDTKTGTVVWSHFYTHDEPVSGKDVSVVVAALDRNVQRGISECESSLDQYFSTHPSVSSAGGR